MESAGAILCAGVAALCRAGRRRVDLRRAPGRPCFAAASVVLTICASTVVVAVDRGRLAFNTRDAPSLWFEWMGRLADLTAATPMWARDADAPSSGRLRSG